MLPYTRKEKVGRTGIYTRAQRHVEILDGYCNKKEIEKMQRLQLLDDEYGVIAEQKRKCELGFAQNTNRQFREYEADLDRIFMIAITEHGLGINHRQARQSRIAQIKKMRDKGRSITIYTQSGVKLGSGLISDNKKYESLCKCEKDKYKNGMGFVPIFYENLQVDDEYKRFAMMLD